MVEGEAVAVVRRLLTLLREHGLEPAFGVVFGSWARGSAGPWSDIDVLVVSPRFDPPVEWATVAALWRLAAQVDARLEPHPCGLRQWAEERGSLIVEVARREGTPVAA